MSSEISITKKKMLLNFLYSQYVLYFHGIANYSLSTKLPRSVFASVFFFTNIQLFCTNWLNLAKGT